MKVQAVKKLVPPARGGIIILQGWRNNRPYGKGRR